MRGRPAKNATVAIAGAVALRATTKALLCEIAAPAGVFTAWVPRSQIARESEVQGAGEYGTLIVTAWWFHASKTNQQFPERPKLQASHGRKSHEPPTKLEDIGGFKEDDFNFTEEGRPAAPEVANPKIVISDDDLPF
jgi:hypothetical protein